MTNIMFTGGGGAGNEALWRLLRGRYSLHFGDADLRAIDPRIPPERRHKLLFANDPEFVAHISGLCRRLDINLLIPGVDEELIPLSLTDQLPASTRLLLPGTGYIEQMLDKLAMISELSKAGIRVPRSQPLSSEVNDFPFPCICKPRRGRGSRDVSVLRTSSDAQAMRESLGESSGAMLLQEKLEGTEYTVQMVCDSAGQLKAVVPVRIEVKRGVTIRAATEAEPRVIAACRSIHAAMPASGCYNIQLMLTPGGEALPFEINPRVSTTLCLVVAAGIDPISSFLGDLSSEDPSAFTAGITLSRHWTNFLDGKY